MKKINNKEVYANVKKHILDFADTQDGQQAKFCEIRDNVEACNQHFPIRTDFAKAAEYVLGGGLLCYTSDLEKFLCETFAEDEADEARIKRMPADAILKRYQYVIGKTYERLCQAFNQNKL